MFGYKKWLADKLFNVGAVVFPRGVPTPIYNFQTPSPLSPGLVKKIGFFLLVTADMIKPYTYVVGVSTAGQMLAEAFSLASCDGSVKPLLRLLRRDKGRCAVLDEHKPGATALLISGVTTTGKAEIVLKNLLEENGIFAESALALIDGEGLGLKILEERNIRFFSLFRTSELFAYYQNKSAGNPKP